MLMVGVKVRPDCGGRAPLDLARWAGPSWRQTLRSGLVNALLGVFAASTTCERQSLRPCRGRACNFHCATPSAHQSQARPRACGSAFCRSRPGIGTTFQSVSWLHSGALVAVVPAPGEGAWGRASFFAFSPSAATVELIINLKTAKALGLSVPL